MYDTESGETFTTTKLAIKNKNVFGKVAYISGTFLPTEAYIEVDDFTWRLLDLIDSPTEVDSVGLTNYTQINARCITNGVDIVLFYPSALSPLDEDLIFWNDGRSNITLLDIYKYVFSQPIKYTSDMNVYVVCSSFRKTYKLDMNKKVISFMEKVMVLC